MQPRRIGVINRVSPNVGTLPQGGPPVYIKFNAPSPTAHPTKQIKLNAIMMCDSDWNKSFCCRSISAHLLLLRTQQEVDDFIQHGTVTTGNLIGHRSKKQADSVAESTKAAENYAIVDGSNTLEFFRNLLRELDMIGNSPSPLLSDNLASVVNGMEFKVPRQTRHNAIKWAKIEERIRSHIMNLFHISGSPKTNWSDIGTKQLPESDLNYIRLQIMAVAESDTVNTRKATTTKLTKKSNSQPTSKQMQIRSDTL
jgi:hypothetical protein